MIIGITGTNGAGKGAVVDFLKKRGFAHYSVRELLSEEAERRELPQNRDTLIDLGNELRDEHGAGYFVEALHKKAEEQGGDAVIESIRTLGEVAALKALPGTLLLAVEAPQKLRYERIVGRGAATDNLSLEEFIAQEEREAGAADPAKQNIPAVIASADIRLENSGSLDELHQKLEEKLAAVLS